MCLLVPFLRQEFPLSFPLFCVFLYLLTLEDAHYLQEQKEVCSVFWILLKILINHLQCTFKHSIKNLGNFTCYVTSQFINNGPHSIQNFWFTSKRHTSPLIIYQYCIQQWRDEVFQNLQIKKHEEENKITQEQIS